MESKTTEVEVEGGGRKTGCLEYREAHVDSQVRLVPVRSGSGRWSGSQ